LTTDDRKRLFIIIIFSNLSVLQPTKHLALGTLLWRQKLQATESLFLLIFKTLTNINNKDY